MALVLDIETVARDGISVEPVSAPSHYKDEAKIAAYVAEKQVEQVSKAALYPWTARVIAIGWCRAGDEAVQVRTANSDAREAALLAEFWEQVSDGRTLAPIVGFNHRVFDLPVLMARSILLGVRHPQVNVDRYRSPNPDLLQILTWNGTIPPRSLKWFAARFGLNVDDAFSGKEIATLYEDGNWDAIVSHVESDVTLTRQIAERLGVIKAPLRVVA